LKAPEVLWIAPNLNHYKVRFLSKLAERLSGGLTVVAGRDPTELGHTPHEGDEGFSRIDVAADRNDFSVRPGVYSRLAGLAFSGRFNVVLMPAERKYLPLILFLRVLRLVGRFRLVSYNHPMTSPSGRPVSFAGKQLIRFMFSCYDRVIFYTEPGRLRAISQGLVPEAKAYFANNTLDTRNIWEGYDFEINESDQFTLLFIGRLVPYRWLHVLFDYFQTLKNRCPGIRLVVIGDGPESDIVKRMAAGDAAVEWRGGVADEQLIREDMRRAHLVFIPGASGLSIVHAFCYGKPYVTMSTQQNHGPEIDYLQDGVNGLLLSGDRDSDCARIDHLLHDRERYRAMCSAAFRTAGRLSVEAWCGKIEEAINFNP
jgi:glycosyltransferase involved in cell wall biosynthesis